MIAAGIFGNGVRITIELIFFGLIVLLGNRGMIIGE
jgi:hypothetical protein